jgi:VanZ family protein
VPLGAGFALWRRAGGWRIVLEGVVLGLVTSVTLEVAQLMTRYRYTSFADVWRNTASCALGCVIAIGVVRLITARSARSDSAVVPRGG